MKLYIARHTSVDVPQGTCYGHTDVPLRNTFNEEAEAVKQKLDGLHFDKVYTSPLSRCIRLASFCGFENAIREKRIMEINFGEWEMKPFDSIIDPRLQDWFNDFIHVRPTGGESFIDLYSRVTQFLEELKKEETGNVLLFAHGGILVCTQVYTGMTEMSKAFEFVPPYGSVAEFEL